VLCVGALVLHWKTRVCQPADRGTQESALVSSQVLVAEHQLALCGGLSRAGVDRRVEGHTSTPAIQNTAEVCEPTHALADAATICIMLSEQPTDP
jgi:hypothetical protein